MNNELITEAVEQLYTVNDLLRWGVSRFEEAGLFYGHGTDNAWDEAASLLLHALHIMPDKLGHALNARLTHSEKVVVIERFKQRIEERKPAAYINNEAWFAGMNFYVDERVLVPRSPLAELISECFSPWLDNVEITDIADVCTGSACIACACAEAFPEAHITAIDISPGALEVARQNVELHGLEEQVDLYESDLFTKVPPQQYQLIISNPPYVDEMAMHILPSEYEHEPQLGLAAGEDGLSVIIPLMQQALDRLTPDGILIIEVGFSEAALVEFFPNIPFTWLEFSEGGQGVFLLTAEQLAAHKEDILRA